MTGPVELTAPSISLLKGCPRRYSLEYETPDLKPGRAPAEKTSRDIRTSLFREAVRACSEKLIGSQKPRPEWVVSASDLRQAVLALVSRTGCDSQTLMDVFATARAAAPLNLANAYDVSVPFEFTVPGESGGPNALVRGHLDLLEDLPDSRLAVIWKTATMAGSDQLADTAQTLVLLAAAHSLDRPRLEYRWPRAQLALGFDWSPAVEARSLGLVRSCAAEIEERRESGDWPATPGEACSGCAFKAGCPGLADTGVKSPYLLPDAELLAERAAVKARHQDEGAYLGVLDEEIRARAGGAGVLEAGGWRGRASIRRMAKVPPGSEKAAVKALMAVGFSEIDQFKWDTWEFPGAGAWKSWLDARPADVREKCKAAIDGLREVIATATLRVTRVGGLEEPEDEEA